MTADPAGLPVDERSATEAAEAEPGAAAAPAPDEGAAAPKGASASSGPESVAAVPAPDRGPLPAAPDGPTTGEVGEVAAESVEPTTGGSTAPSGEPVEPTEPTAAGPAAPDHATDGALPADGRTARTDSTGDTAPPAGRDGTATGPDSEADSAATYRDATGPDSAAELAALREQVGHWHSDLASSLQAIEDKLASLAALPDRVDELARLRERDTNLADRLHADVTRLRSGEIAQAITPVVLGMLKLHDLMVSLGAADDPKSVAGLLHSQLLQSLELTAGVRPFSPATGEPYDSKLHTGVRGVPTTNPAGDSTIAKTVRVGFTRADGSLVRPADVEVHRLSG